MCEYYERENESGLDECFMHDFNGIEPECDDEDYEEDFYVEPSRFDKSVDGDLNLYIGFEL
jgi:hypothetical protein